MLYNIKVVYLHCFFHGIRFKVNEDWESGKIPFFFYVPIMSSFQSVLSFLFLDSFSVFFEQAHLELGDNPCISFFH